MSNENPNNTPNWRNKLDDLEHLPDSAFNSDVAWDKLHGRLRGNKKSKRIFWYWMAAACLVFGLVITLLNFQKSSSGSLNKETAIKKDEKIDNSTLKVKVVNKNENENLIIPEKDKIAISPNKPIQRKRRIVPTEVAAQVRSSDVATNNPEQQEPLAKPLQIINNNSTTTVPPKKKLNVVHINELGDPVESDMVGKIDRQYKIRLANGEVYANPSTVYKNTDFTILKTKL